MQTLGGSATGKRELDGIGTHSDRRRRALEQEPSQPRSLDEFPRVHVLNEGHTRCPCKQGSAVARAQVHAESDVRATPIRLPGRRKGQLRHGAPATGRLVGSAADLEPVLRVERLRTWRIGCHDERRRAPRMLNEAKREQLETSHVGQEARGEHQLFSLSAIDELPVDGDRAVDHAVERADLEYARPTGCAELTDNGGVP